MHNKMIFLLSIVLLAVVISSVQATPEWSLGDSNNFMGTKATNILPELGAMG
jgi:hypothetical protein